MKYVDFTRGLVALALSILGVAASIAAAQPIAAPKAVVVVYEDGTTVTVQPWRFRYLCEASVVIPFRGMRRFTFDDKRLLLHLGNRVEGKITLEDNRLINAADLRSIQWHYKPKQNSPSRSRVVSEVTVTLRSGEVFVLPRLKVSHKLAAKVTRTEGATIRRIHLSGKAKTSSGETGDFLQPNLDSVWAGNTAADTLVEIRFHQQGK